MSNIESSRPKRVADNNYVLTVYCDVHHKHPAGNVTIAIEDPPHVVFTPDPVCGDVAARAMTKIAKETTTMRSLSERLAYIAGRLEDLKLGPVNDAHNLKCMVCGCWFTDTQRCPHCSAMLVSDERTCQLCAEEFVSRGTVVSDSQCCSHAFS